MLKALAATVTGPLAQLLLQTRRGWRLGILGVIGGLLGAGLGELFLHMTRPPEFAKAEGPRSICLVIDCSGSMSGSKVDEVRRAAEAFVHEQWADNTEMAVVHFSDDASIRAPLSRDISQVLSGARGNYAQGSTAMHSGLELARQALQGATGTRQVLLFTDGMPNFVTPAVLAAQQMRQAGIQVFAIGTADSNFEVLRGVTGHPRRVISARSGHFNEAFAEAGRLIRDASLLHEGGGFMAMNEALRCGAWSASVGLCLGLAFLFIQVANPGSALRLRTCLVRVLSCALLAFIVGAGAQLTFIATRSGIVAMSIDSMLLGAGLAALLGYLWIYTATPRLLYYLALGGAAYGLAIVIGAQVLAVRYGWTYWMIAILRATAWVALGNAMARLAIRLGTYRDHPAMEVGGPITAFLAFFLLTAVEVYYGEAPFITESTTRLVGWTVLGAAFGLTMAAFVPNLEWRLASLAGAAGGLLGGASFLVVTAYFEGFAARFVGAALLGLWIGMMLEITVAVQDRIREAFRQFMGRRRARKDSIARAAPVGIRNQSWNDQLRDQRTRITSQIRDRLMQ